MTAQQAFNSLRERFRKAKLKSPELEATWMLEHYANISYLKQLEIPDQIVDDMVMKRIDRAVERRLEGEPLAYVLGYREFFSHRFAVTPDVLIPRPETEHLVEWAINWVHDQTTGRDEVRVLDLGTGSGCIAVSIARLIEGARVTAVDISPKALAVAKLNAETAGVVRRIEFIEHDAATIANRLDGEKFDLVLANPPYIDVNDRDIDDHVKKYEPALALFAGNQGLSAIAKWLSQAPTLLKERGAVGFEIGASQSATVLKLASDLGVFSKQYILKDLANHDRVFCAEREPVKGK